jgi:hypothetical protein
MPQTIGTPLPCPELNLQPEQAIGAELSPNMQQVLSLLTAFWRNQRVVLKATPTGSLCVCSGQVKDVYHVTADEDDYVKQGDDIPCSEVVVRGHPDNNNTIWVHYHTAAETTKSWPLAKNEVVSVTLSNLSKLHLLIKKTDDTAIVLYTE